MFKNYYAVFAKRLLVGWCILQGLLSVAISAPPTIRIINGTKNSVAFALVRTKRGTKYKELYVEVGLKEPKKSDKTAWAEFQHAVKDALVALKDIIKIEVLKPDPKGVVMDNFPQKIDPETMRFAYDRALWIVPLTKLDKLVASLGAAKLADSSVIALEVGSATTAEIADNNGKFKLNTSGKLTEGAKALFNSLIGADQDVEVAGEVSLSDASVSKIKELQRDYQIKKQTVSSASNKAKQKKIADKYR